MQHLQVMPGSAPLWLLTTKPPNHNQGATPGCRYGGFVADYDAAYEGVKAGIMQAFYGPPKGGVFSPSVQFTLMEMGKAVLAK